MNLSDNVKQNDGSAIPDDGSTTVNNAGTFMAFDSTNTKMDAVSPAYAGYLGGSVPADTNNPNTDQALSDGNFAHNNQSPIAKGLTTVLGGGAVDSRLLSGAMLTYNDTDSIHAVENITTTRTATAIRGGQFFIAGRANDRYNFNPDPTTATDAFGNDNAARVSRATPGNLVYKLGGPSSGSNPVVDSYYSTADEKTG